MNIKLNLINLILVVIFFLMLLLFSGCDDNLRMLMVEARKADRDGEKVCWSMEDEFAGRYCLEYSNE